MKKKRMKLLYEEDDEEEDNNEKSIEDKNNEEELQEEEEEKQETLAEAKPVGDPEDPVLLILEDSEQKPYVAIIKDITQRRYGSMMMTGQWFYRPEEAPKKVVDPGRQLIQGSSFIVSTKMRGLSSLNVK
ncbi:unnamed protein product [Lupinus luteus]|uniref:BAH domain-containing protein n=1 Tax=Lupinus luteus TaxID=3873 RepID=A0AAV1XTX8_LUPLU